MEEELKVIITRGTNGNQRSSEVSIDLISSPRWGDITGGVRQHLNAYYLLGYISYEEAEKLVNCSGRHNRGYNDALVVINKPESAASPYYKGYKKLAALAGPKPPSKISCTRPKGQPPCTKKILSILSSGPKKRGELREELLSLGYQATTIRGALHRFKVSKTLIFEGSVNSPNQILRLPSESSK